MCGSPSTMSDLFVGVRSMGAALVGATGAIVAVATGTSSNAAPGLLALLHKMPRVRIAARALRP